MITPFFMSSIPRKVLRMTACCGKGSHRSEKVNHFIHSWSQPKKVFSQKKKMCFTRFTLRVFSQSCSSIIAALLTNISSLPYSFTVALNAAEEKKGGRFPIPEIRDSQGSAIQVRKSSLFSFGVLREPERLFPFFCWSVCLLFDFFVWLFNIHQSDIRLCIYMEFLRRRLKCQLHSKGELCLQLFVLPSQALFPCSVCIN